MKFGRQRRRRKELGGRWAANLSACLLILRHCRAQDKGQVDTELFHIPQRAPGPGPAPTLYQHQQKACPAWGNQLSGPTSRLGHSNSEWEGP